jgi:hypothetical protein
MRGSFFTLRLGSFGTFCPEAVYPKIFIIEGLFMPLPVRYEIEVKTVPFGSGTIRIENLTPILSPKDREKRKREIESRLFDVFSKYPDRKRK